MHYSASQKNIDPFVGTCCLFIYAVNCYHATTESTHTALSYLSWYRNTHTFPGADLWKTSINENPIIIFNMPFTIPKAKQSEPCVSCEKLEQYIPETEFPGTYESR